MFHQLSNGYLCSYGVIDLFVWLGEALDDEEDFEEEDDGEDDDDDEEEGEDEDPDFDPSNPRLPKTKNNGTPADCKQQ